MFKGHQPIMPYFVVNEAKDFITFLEKVFDGVVDHIQLRDSGLIGHAEVIVSNSRIMVADATDEWRVCNNGLFVYVDDVDTTYKKALDNNCKSLFKPGIQPWGARMAGVDDKFGNTWWITYYKST